MTASLSDLTTTKPLERHRLTDAIAPDSSLERPVLTSRKIGVLPGEGIGPEVVAAALQVLDALQAARPLGIECVTGGAIGLAASKDGDVTHATAQFCDDLFQEGAAIFCGPGGGRFVYDLRDKFDLFCKFAPLKPSPHLRDATRLRDEALHNVDMVIVRDNAAGIYQGRAATHTEAGEQIAQQTFEYRESQVERLVQTGTRLARQRAIARGIPPHMHVVVKDGGVPAISNLWKRVAERVASQAGVTCAFLNADYAAYYMIQHPHDLDVVVTPNMIGDILADLGGALLGSRGLTFSGNFSACGRGVYQTGHGAAYDLAGTGRANPVGQILALAMMLRESFALDAEAELIEQAVENVFREGWRTDDLCWSGAPASAKRLGLRDMTARIADAVQALARQANS